MTLSLSGAIPLIVIASFSMLLRQLRESLEHRFVCCASADDHCCSCCGCCPQQDPRLPESPQEGLVPHCRDTTRLLPLWILSPSQALKDPDLPKSKEQKHDDATRCSNYWRSSTQRSLPKRAFRLRQPSYSGVCCLHMLLAWEDACSDFSEATQSNTQF